MIWDAYRGCSSLCFGVVAVVQAERARQVVRDRLDFTGHRSKSNRDWGEALTRLHFVTIVAPFYWRSPPSELVGDVSALAQGKGVSLSLRVCRVDQRYWSSRLTFTVTCTYPIMYW